MTDAPDSPSEPTDPTDAPSEPTEPEASSEASEPTEPAAAAPHGSASAPADRRSFALAAFGVALVVVLVVVGLTVRSRGDDPAPSAAPAPTLTATTLAAGTAAGTVPTGDATVEPTFTGETFPADATTTPPNTYPLPPSPYLVAVPKANGPFPIYPSPGAAAPARTLDNPHLVDPKDPKTGVPLHLLVRQKAAGGWLEVFLPVRPNGSTGFVRESDVTVSSHAFHIEIRLSQFNLRVFNGDKVILDAPIAVASNNSPTPGGLYYTTELIKPPQANGPYGTYAYGLSGFSDVYQSFNGGPGQIGIHGTNDPSSIGRAVSHGCIRLRNQDIEALAPVLPLGVPVQIFA